MLGYIILAVAGAALFHFVNGIGDDWYGPIAW